MKRISRMKQRARTRTALRLIPGLLLWLGAASPGTAQNDDQSASRPGGVKVLAVEGENAWRLPSGSNEWMRLQAGQTLRYGDRGRTGARTRLMLRLEDEGEISIPERSEFLVEPPAPEESFSMFSILRGMGYFFHRGEPRKVRFKSRTASAAVRGTEFLFAVDDEGRTTVTLFDGEVDLSNDAGTLELSGGQAGLAVPGMPPRRAPYLEAAQAVQWRLYYPAILDPADLVWDDEVRERLADSLDSYEQGDPQQALANYPTNRVPATTDESIYLSALLLSVGQVAEAEHWLDRLANAGAPSPRVARLAAASRQLIGTVRSGTPPASEIREGDPPAATVWMSRSYAEQARGDLNAARASAQRAVEISPEFGFAWVRWAEMEFGFGRHREALRHLQEGVRRSPRNAEAHSLRGFLWSARNENDHALASFERALFLDGGLGHAWLGRGLCRIRSGMIREGLVDLEIAAATEPQRSVLRSYLGKAFNLVGETDRAEAELELARKLDPNDPTSWLYSALLHQQHNRINEAIQELETSQALNDNRQVFRSRLLLDQDQAVRGANLAGIYLDAGMDDVGFREAARSVNLDYANYAAHVFLANSYNQLRDPTRVGLRYDSAWFTEYLLANLLAPPGAGVLSQTVSQQEYGRLFERNRLGVVAASQYLSSGDWSQAGAVLGNYGDFAFAVDEGFQSRHGQRANNDLEQWTLSLQLKQQMTPEDGIFFQAIYFDAQGGDLVPVYDPDDASMVNRGFRFEEKQEPILMAGYHHEWSPRSHTLLMAGRLEDRIELENPRQQTAIVSRDGAGEITDALPILMEQSYESDVEVYTTEAQQIWQSHAHTWIAGSRYQLGRFDTGNFQTDPRPPVVAPFVPDLRQDAVSDFQRWSGYGYYQWRVADPFLLVGGLSYDWIKYPANHRFGPVSDEERTADQVSPKGGFIWTPSETTSFRGGYARSLGGVTLEQSLRLEPSQVAGFNQAYSSIIPEAAGGSSSAAELETWGLEWDQRFGTRTYLGVRGEWLESDVEREVGAFDLVNPPVVASSLEENLDYRERTLTVMLHQLLGDTWVAGAVYRLSDAELNNRFEGVPSGLPGGFDPAQEVEATLHQLRMFAMFNHPGGFFFQFDSVWSAQSNRGYEVARPGDDFWQFNVWAGYRFFKRRAEVRVGLLNVTDRDYRLNPLNLTPELQRDRTLAVSLRLEF
jgi:tetratricopeptide (TPR) repeat protein